MQQRRYEYVLPFLGFAVLYIIADHFLSEFYTKQLSSINLKVSEVSYCVYDSLENIETVLYFNNQHLECENVIPSVKSLAKHKSSFTRKAAAIDLSKKLIYCIVINVFANINRYDTEIDITDFAFMCTYLINFISNINGIDSAIRQVREAQISLQTVRDIDALDKVQHQLSNLQILNLFEVNLNVPFIEFRKCLF
jgi:ABC-type multidrug transport system fused ATPase/permease subunit